MLPASVFSRSGTIIAEHVSPLASFRGEKINLLRSRRKVPWAAPSLVLVTQIKAFAQNSRKKMVNITKTKSRDFLKSVRPLPKSDELLDSKPKEDGNQQSTGSGCGITNPTGSIPRPSRGAVLQACISTSGLLLALGAVIRQVSSTASTEGWLFLDTYTEVSFGFEMWHIGLIVGLVLLISSSRYILLNSWPDFSESSEAANQQVLSSLQPLDYIVVAFLPGITEELLFRGSLLPLFGLNWRSALATAAIFGILHLGSGRKYSFAIWATFVGFAYGWATIVSSSIIVPMATHSVNNLVGAIIWRYLSNQKDE